MSFNPDVLYDMTWYRLRTLLIWHNTNILHNYVIRIFIFSNETRKNATERTIASLQQEKNCLEQELINARAKLDQIQSDLKLLKTEQVHQQNPSNGTIDDLLQQNRKLEDDKELYMLRDKVCSLENYKIKFEEK